MGIRFQCPVCRGKLHVKEFLAGKRGVCPKCQARIWIPEQSEVYEALLADGDEGEPVTVPSSLASQPATQAKTGPASDPSSRRSTGQRGVSDRVVSRPVAREPSPPVLPPIPKSTVKPEVPSTTVTAHGTSIRGGIPATASRADDDGSRGPVPTGSSATRDVFAEAPGAVWHVRPVAGGQYGPADATTMRQWVNEGRVPPDALVWRNDWSQWQRASEVLAACMPSVVSPELPVTVMGPSVASSAGLGGKVDRAHYLKRKKHTRWTAAVVLLTMIAIGLVVTLIVVLRRG